MTRITNKTSRAMTTPITEAIETGSGKKRLKLANFFFFFCSSISHKMYFTCFLGNSYSQTQFITVKNCSQQRSGYV